MFIYDEVKGLYKEAGWGNPGIGPVVLFKIVFVQYLYGIRSMRQTIKIIFHTVCISSLIHGIQCICL